MDSTLALGALRIARDAGGEGVDVNGNLGFRNLLGARRGLRGQFSVQSDNRFSGRGGGGGEPPQGVAASWGDNPLRRRLKNLFVFGRLFLRRPLGFPTSQGRGGLGFMDSTFFF